MRLQCPNCDAEYEVDASAIPLEGRDVQCSNCGHGWFQSHPDYETDYELESALYDPPPPLPQGDAVAGAMPKRELDPEAQRILREEVAREEALRAAEAARAAPAQTAPPEAAPPQTTSPPDSAPEYDIEAELDAQNFAQGDIAPPRQEAAPVSDSQLAETSPTLEPDSFEASLDAAQGGADGQDSAAFDPLPQIEPAPVRVSPRRVARLKGLNAAAKGEAEPIPAAPPMTAPAAPLPRDWQGESRSPEPDLRRDVQMTAPPRKSGRRAGFYSAILIAIAGAAGYITAPDLAQMVPALAPALESYIQVINAARDQLQQNVPLALNWAMGVWAQIAG